MGPEQEALARLAAIVEYSDDAIIGKTPEGIITSWNRGAERIYGYPAAEVLGKPVTILAPPERIDELRQVQERVRRGEHVRHLETVRLTRDGRRLDMSLTLSPIFGADGAVVGISTIARDITERTRLERLLRDSEKRYHTQVELAPDAIIVHQEGRFVYANCAALGIYGAGSLQELQQLSVLDLVHPEERAMVIERNRQLLEGGEIPLRECRLLRLDGQTVPVETSSILIEYQGQPSIQVIARDISLRKRVEREREALREELEFQRTRFETVLQQMPIGVMIAEAPSGRMVYNNRASEQIFREQFPTVAGFADYGKWRVSRLDGSPLPVEQYPIVRALKGETVIGEELQFARGDGSCGFVSVNAAPIRDANGRIESGVAAFVDITEKMAALEALRQSEERLNLALDATGMGSCDMDLRSGKGIWSQQHFLLLGYSPPESGSGPADFGMWQGLIHPEDLAGVRLALERARAGHSLCRTEHRVFRVGDARMVWVDVLGRFSYDPLGEPKSFTGVIFEVTERKEAEEKLRESELRHRLLFETSLQGIVYHDDRDRIIMANPAAQAILGRSQSELLGKTVPELGLSLEREDGTPFPANEIPCSVAIRTGQEVRDVVLKISNCPGRDTSWLSISSVPLFREGAEQPYQVYAIVEDITPRKRAEDVLRASEAKFRWLFESNLIAIFFWNKDGRITQANQAYCDLLGVSAGECQAGGLNWLDATPPEHFAKDFAAVEEIMATGSCRPYEKEFIHRGDLHRVPVLCAGAKMLGADSEGMGFAIDLTELKRVENALRESEATLKLAIEITGLGTYESDLVSGERHWSDIAKRHFGLPAQEEVTEGTFLAGVHPEDRERVQRVKRDALNHAGEGKYSVKYRTVGIRDGKERWIFSSGRTLFDEKGAAVRFVGACLDVTDIVVAETALKEEIAERLRTVEELHRQQQLLIRQGRMAALGEMIGNIAHQWRQPLNTLALIVQELPWYYARGQFSQEYLDANVTRAMQVINHMSKTIDGFRNFFEPDKEAVTFRVSDVLAQTISIVEAAFNELRLRIEVHAEAEVFAHGCPNEFSQVILNILMNAKDAILERQVPQPRVVVRLVQEGGKAVLTIADNAGGIPQEILDKIFDPYFTTKGPDKGTGIGLFMSRTIIEKNMHGTLSARNTEEGAEFRIEV